MRTSSRTKTVLSLTAAAGLVALGAAPATAQDSGAQVYVLHGIPGTPVDVYVNGDRVLDDFAPKAITDDLALPAGSYEVQVFPADAADAGGTPSSRPRCRSRPPARSARSRT